MSEQVNHVCPACFDDIAVLTDVQINGNLISEFGECTKCDITFRIDNLLDRKVLDNG